MDQGGTLVGKSIRADDGKRDRHGEHGDKRGNDREEEHEALSAPASLMGLAPAARADGGEGEEGEEGILGEVHETLGNLLLPLVLLHVLCLLVFRFDMACFMLFLPRRRG
ncbi:hypothetical protein [Novosphingobium sp. TH158]|uniref:hypothetical protein n=1 Tax=Novosphingobium sp. TH158 TaxID=2067455 RepID=UPI000C7BC5A9|nr:hypothetical protein [Novosphingobium sp. TH158]PLK25893.1 hypothetical protein C0V78_02535 [Novosphingobium sp. TH158]